jgi:glycosyltransferase involved in cell wall biosynthesis
MSDRVVLIIPTMDRGGAEKQVCLLAAGLPKLDFDVHVVLLTRGGLRESQLRENGVAYTIVGKRGKLDPTAFFRLKRVLKDLRPDLVHTFLFAANSYGRAAAKMIGVPVVIASERCVDPWKTWRHAIIDRKLSNISAAITTNSVGVKDFYVQRGIAAEKFEIIPNGIDGRPTSHSTREEMAAKYQLDTNRRWIAAVGRLWPQKRYRDLIWAGEMINTLRGDDTCLVIIGDGPQRDELLRYRDSVSDDTKVRFIGQREDVHDLLPHLDAFWLASEYEGQSNALMEAMRDGVGCVVSDIPGNRDLIEHDVTGMLVKLADAADFVRQTQHLWEHPELASSIKTAASNRIATEFTVEKMITRHAELYRRLLTV